MGHAKGAELSHLGAPGVVGLSQNAEWLGRSSSSLAQVDHSNKSPLSFQLQTTSLHVLYTILTLTLNTAENFSGKFFDFHLNICLFILGEGTCTQVVLE